MKKLHLVLALSLVIGLSACNENSKKRKEKPKPGVGANTGGKGGQNGGDADLDEGTKLSDLPGASLVCTFSTKDEKDENNGKTLVLSVDKDQKTLSFYLGSGKDKNDFEPMPVAKTKTDEIFEMKYRTLKLKNNFKAKVVVEKEDKKKNVVDFVYSKKKAEGKFRENRTIIAMGKECEVLDKDYMEPAKPEQEQPEQKQPEQKQPEQEQPEQEQPEQEQPEQEQPEQEQPEQEQPEQEQPEQEQPEQEQPEQA